MGGGEGLPGVFAEAGAPGGEVGDAEGGAGGGELAASGDLRPGQRHGDGTAEAGAGRVGSDGGSAALVAEVVEVDAAGAGRLGHLGEVERWIRLLHGEDEAVGEVFCVWPSQLGLNRDDDVETFAAGGLEEAGEAEFAEARADLGGGGGDGGPGERFVGVEVEDEAVGVLERIVARAPGMDFEDAELRERGESFRRGGFFAERDVGLDDAGFLVAHIDGADAGWERGVDVLLEEAGLGRALGAAHDGERAAGDVRQHARGDGEVVVGERLLGEAGFAVEDFGGVGEADGGMVVSC